MFKENIHPLRERRKHFGELIQIDASIHPWFGMDKPKATLHGAIDDASGKVLALWFDDNETLNGYYHMLYIILTEYGIPEAYVKKGYKSISRGPNHPWRKFVISHKKDSKHKG